MTFLYLYISSPDDDLLGLKHAAIIKTNIVFIMKNSCINRNT